MARYRPDGIHCPHCGCVRMVVTRTRREAPGVTVRDRKCGHCARSVLTRETVIPHRRRPNPRPCEKM